MLGLISYTSLPALIVLLAILVGLGIGIVVCTVMFTRGVREHIRYNNAVLPTLESEEAEGGDGETDDEPSAFHLDSVFAIDEKDGYESDAWFSHIREQEGRYDAEDIIAMSGEEKGSQRSAHVSEMTTGDLISDSDEGEAVASRRRSPDSASLPDL